MNSRQSPNHWAPRDRASAPTPRRWATEGLWSAVALVLILAMTALSAGARVLADAAIPVTGEWAERAAGRPTPGPAGVGQPSPQPTPAVAAGPGGCPPQSASAPAEWPVVACDTFDDNRGNWQLGATQRDTALITKEIAGGLFVVDVDAQRSLLNFSMSALGPLSDFYAAVDVRIVTGPPDGVEYGLVLRQQDDDNQYFILVSEANGVLLYREVGGEATVPVNWTPVPASRPNAWNRIGLQARGTQLTLYINDQPSLTYTDDVVLSGQLGLIARLTSAGHAVIQFDNFEVRAPSAAVAPAVDGPTVQPQAVPPQAATPAPPVQAGPGQCPPGPSVAPADWPLVICDTFDDNASGWTTREMQRRGGVSRENIANGVYSFEADATDKFLDLNYARLGSFSDFYMAVDVRVVEDTTSGGAEYGLVFRSNGTDQVYMFYVSDSKGVLLYRQVAGQATVPIAWLPTAAIRPREWNHVAVKGAGKQLNFYINNEQVAEFSDEATLPGELGFMVFVGGAGHLVVDFDNFEVRAPEGSRVLPPTATSPRPPTAAVCPSSPVLDADRWPLLMCDTFDDNRNNWKVGSSQDETYTEERSIADGRYRWRIQTFQSCTLNGLARLDEASDFYAAVDVRRASGMASSIWYGLQFRVQDAANLYMFVASDSGAFSVFRKSSGEWSGLLRQVPSDAIRPGEWNRLAVQAMGPDFVFYINDRPVGHVRDETHAKGRFRLVTEILSEDDIVLEFDNFEVRAAPPDAALTPLPTLVPTPTGTPTTGPTPTPSPTPWSAPKPPAQASVASCPLSSAGSPSDWPLLMCDTFDDNINNWETGLYQDMSGTTYRTVSDGALIWDMDASGVHGLPVTANVGSLRDFYAAVDVFASDEFAESVVYGFHFRSSEGEGYYHLTIVENVYVILAREVRRQSANLVLEKLPDGTFHHNAWNRLAVKAVGPSLSVFVNDREVGRVVDASLSAGQLMLFAATTKPGHPVVFFDNFEVRRAAAPTPPPPPTANTRGCPPPSTVAPADWPVLMCEAFDADSVEVWGLKDTCDERACARRYISNGLFIWDVEAYERCRTLFPAPLGPVADFYAAVDVLVVSESATDVEYDLAFRVRNQNNQYWFQLSSDGIFAVYRLLDGASNTLAIGDMPAGVLRPGEWNRLAVVAVGPVIVGYVNEQEVARVSDPFLVEGQFVLEAVLLKPGRHIVYFDNFEVRQAPPNAQPPPTPRKVFTSCPGSPAVAPADWPILACDSFDDNTYGWWVGKQSLLQTEGEVLKRIDGAYVWAFTSKSGVTIWEWSQLPPVGDFFASVQAKRTSLSEETGYGLMFRAQDGDNYFVFLVNDQQQYWVEIEVNGFSRKLIEPTKSAAIRPGQTNTLAVRGEGRHFTFYINDQQVAGLVDIHFKQGRFALVSSLQQIDQGRIEFDNFEVRTPQGR